MALAVDVGGANGALLRLLQQANPALRGIVFDRPDVAAAVAADIAGDRTEVVGGDFFEALPAADLYLLKFILHDWDDESCVKILSRCREAMVPGGRIAIIDFLIGDRDDPGVMALMDLNMLAVAAARNAHLRSLTRCWRRRDCGAPRCGRRTRHTALSKPLPSSCSSRVSGFGTRISVSRDTSRRSTAVRATRTIGRVAQPMTEARTCAR